MVYVSVPMPNLISVDGIYTVLKVDYSKTGVGIGEAHAFPEINYISKGEHTVIRDGKSSVMKKGQLTIMEPGTFHKSAKPSNSEGLIISFETSSPMLSSIYGIPIFLNEKQDKEYREIVEIGLNLFCERDRKEDVLGMVLKEGVDKYEVEVFKKRFELFLIDLHKNYAKPQSLISARRESEFKSVREYLLKNVSLNLSAEDIANDNLICLSKLKQIFRSKGGVKNYFITLKIERSKELISEGKLNFTEISESLGFSSIHYFSKTFKKLTGITPSQYEKGKGIYY